MTRPAVFYFGCVGDIGHYLHSDDGRVLRRSQTATAVPFGPAELDTPFCPRTPGGGEVTNGLAKVTHTEGWSVLSFWDNSVDTRPGSHSTFLAEGTRTFDEMVALAKEAFPKVWKRYEFKVALAT